jgi:hypothetical protein
MSDAWCNLSPGLMLRSERLEAEAAPSFETRLRALLRTGAE